MESQKKHCALCEFSFVIIYFEIGYISLGIYSEVSVMLCLDARHHEPQLSYLFDEDKLSLDSDALIYKLQASEKIR